MIVRQRININISRVHHSHSKHFILLNVSNSLKMNYYYYYYQISNSKIIEQRTTRVFGIKKKNIIAKDRIAMCPFIYNDNPTRRTFVSQRSNFVIGTVPTVSTKNDMSLFFGKYLLFPTTILSTGSQLGFTCRQRYTV